MICTTLSVIAGWCGGTVAPEYAEVSRVEKLFLVCLILK